jgi:hypothetical protein
MEVQYIRNEKRSRFGDLKYACIHVNNLVELESKLAHLYDRILQQDAFVVKIQFCNYGFYTKSSLPFCQIDMILFIFYN